MAHHWGTLPPSIPSTPCAKWEPRLLRPSPWAPGKTQRSVRARWPPSPLPPSIVHCTVCRAVVGARQAPIPAAPALPAPSQKPAAPLKKPRQPLTRPTPQLEVCRARPLPPSPPDPAGTLACVVAPPSGAPPPLQSRSTSWPFCTAFSRWVLSPSRLDGCTHFFGPMTTPKGPSLTPNVSWDAADPRAPCPHPSLGEG